MRKISFGILLALLMQMLLPLTTLLPQIPVLESIQTVQKAEASTWIPDGYKRCDHATVAIGETCYIRGELITYTGSKVPPPGGCSTGRFTHTIYDGLTDVKTWYLCITNASWVAHQDKGYDVFALYQHNQTLAGQKWFQILNVEKAWNPNQEPDIPDLEDPKTNQEYSGNCDESVTPSTGACRTQTSVTTQARVNDPDTRAEYDMKHSYFTYSGGRIGDSSTYPGDGWARISHTTTFNDGQTWWYATSVDKKNASTNSLDAAQDQDKRHRFITDTTPPDVPVLTELPEWSPAVGINDTKQVEVFSSVATDNILNDTYPLGDAKNYLGYIIEYSLDPSFSEIKTPNYTKPSQYFTATTPRFEFGPKGLDQIEGTSDDLVDGGTYYFRAKTHDKILANGNRNTSAWSNVVSTTIDGTLPEVKDYTVNTERISSDNPTSVGIADTAEFEMVFNELHPKEARIEIYLGADLTDSASNPVPVKVLSEDVSTYENEINDITVNFTWDGTNDSGETVHDGGYVAFAVLEDKAGNLSHGNVVLNQEDNPSYLIIVDNNEANITITSPIDQFWTAMPNMDITGQAKSPHDFGPDEIENTPDDEQDQDLSNFVYTDNQMVITKPVPADPDGIFSIPVSLINGTNTFTFLTTDTVGNQQEKILTVNRDVDAPEISGVLPNDLINDITVTGITFTVDDYDVHGDSTQISGIAHGTNPPGYNMWVTYDTIDTDTGELVNNRKDLITYDPALQNSTITDAVLTGNLQCVANTPSETKNNVPSAQSVSCTLPFINNFTTETRYTIHLQTFDIAGNMTSNETTQFLYDASVYHEVTAPVEGGVYATSGITLAGTVSQDAELVIENTTLGESRTFIVNDALNGSGMETEVDAFILSDFIIDCSLTADEDQDPATPDEQVCSWQVDVLQSYSMDNIDTQNTYRIIATDPAGNTQEEVRNVVTNLHAITFSTAPEYQFISPNGDGKQDGVTFVHSIDLGSDPLNQPEIATWELHIRNTNSEPETHIRLNGSGPLPPISYFDGQFTDSSNKKQWIPDGTYAYTLHIVTSDGIELSTDAAQIQARTVLTEEVVITAPADGTVTSQGVITVQGQAPTTQNDEGEIGFLRGETQVTLCIDTLTQNDTVSCDYQTTITEISPSGFFSAVVPLPLLENENQVRHTITAIAEDNFGNQTPESNAVTVVYDVIDPFTGIAITPTFSGITSQSEYEQFLSGEISIDSIRSVQLTAYVTENTNAVELGYANYINVSEKPENPTYDYIALINDIVETDIQLNPFDLPSIKKNHGGTIAEGEYPQAICTEAQGCTWEYQLPITYGFGGVYEVEFTGKKDALLQTMTAGFTVDGSIPASPKVMVVEQCREFTPVESEIANESWCNSDWIRIKNVQGNYYAKGGLIRYRGAAEPLMPLSITSNSVTVSEGTASAGGVFELYVDADELLVDVPANNVLDLTCDAYATIDTDRVCRQGVLGLDLFGYELNQDESIRNTVPSEDVLDLHIDTIPAALTKIERSTPGNTIDGWVRTGDQVQYSIRADEKLAYADVVKEDGFVRRMFSFFDLSQWAGSFNVDRPEEGYYLPDFNTVDASGNEMFYDGEFWEQYELGDYRLYIDNTKPEPTSIDVSEWSTTYEQGGVNADRINPEVGRTNPHYVVYADTLTLHGLAERNQGVELFIDNKVYTTINVSDDTCAPVFDEDTITDDGLIVQYADVCRWEYTFTFPDDGSNTYEGVPDHFYMFQVRTIDKAANEAEISREVIVFHDTQKPYTPYITNAASASYSTIPGWTQNASSASKPVTRDTSVTLTSIAERLSDMQFTQLNPGAAESERTVFPIFMNDTSRVDKTRFELGTQRDQRAGCMTMNGKRRVGVCEDGFYDFTLQSTDAAGNQSDVLRDVKIERDTVSPVRPTVQLNKSGDILNGEVSSITIDGEPFTSATIKVVDNSGNTFYRYATLNANGIYSASSFFGLACGNVTYSVYVRLTDRAGNTSDFSLPKRITSLECPRCGFIDEDLVRYPVTEDHTVYNDSKFRTNQRPGHDGWDFNVTGDQNGNEPVYPFAPGKVVNVRYGMVCNGTLDCNARYEDSSVWAFGNYVQIEHENGYHSYYLHLMPELSPAGKNADRLFDSNGYVQKGDYVSFDDQIGRIGNTGNSKGYHLHFEVRKNGVPVDPAFFFKAGAKNLTEEEARIFCDGLDGEAPDRRYTTISRSTARNKFTEYIENKLVQSESTIKKVRDGSREKVPIDSIEGELRDFVSGEMFMWNMGCSENVWILELGYGKYDNTEFHIGALILNPFVGNGKVYILIDDIWEKYREIKGPCKDGIGVPKDTGDSAWLSGSSKQRSWDSGYVWNRKTSYYQFFQDDELKEVTHDESAGNISLQEENPNMIISSRDGTYYTKDHAAYYIDMEYFDKRKKPKNLKSDPLEHKCSEKELDRGFMQKYEEKVYDFCYHSDWALRDKYVTKSTTWIKNRPTFENQPLMRKQIPIRGGHVNFNRGDFDYNNANVGSKMNLVERYAELNFYQETDESFIGKLKSNNAKLWIFIHGWNGDPWGEALEMAHYTKQMHPQDVMLIVDWTQGADTLNTLVDLPGDTDIPAVNHAGDAATWIRPTALSLHNYIVGEFPGLAPSNIHFFAHSYGAAMSIETSALFNVTEDSSRPKISIADLAQQAPGLTLQTYPAPEGHLYGRTGGNGDSKRYKYKHVGDSTSFARAFRTIQSVSGSEAGMMDADEIILVEPKKTDGFQHGVDDHTLLHQVMRSLIEIEVVLNSKLTSINGKHIFSVLEMNDNGWESHGNGDAVLNLENPLVFKNNESVQMKKDTIINLVAGDINIFNDDIEEFIKDSVFIWQ